MRHLSNRPGTRSGAPLGAQEGSPRGQILVLFAFVLVALLVVSALAVDYGGWLLARRSYQNVADAAALAGADQLTSPITSLDCPLAGSGGSKNACARAAAWRSIKTALNLSSTFDPDGEAIGASNVPYTENGYSIWVASPPSDAGAKYPGAVSSSHTIFVWVERVETANLSRVVRPAGQTVSAWATAGRIPQNFAFVGLCYQGASFHLNSDCRNGSHEDVTIDGGSTVVLHSGDMGVNTWVKTNGNNSYVALGTDTGAYMGSFSTCWAAGTSCSLVDWVDPPGVIGGPRSAIPLGPRIQDPQYPGPTTNSTTVPWQCGGSGGIAMGSDPWSDSTAVLDPPMKLTSAVLPAPPPVVTLGAATAGGQVTAFAGGAGLNGISMKLTGPSSPAAVLTAKVGGNNGMYTISGVTPAGAYTLTATDPTNVYATTSVGVTVPASGTVTTNMVLHKNPVISGVVQDTSLVAVVGATVTFSGSGGPYTVVSGAGGAYSVTVKGAGSFVGNASKAGYGSAGPYTVVTVLDGTPTQNFTLSPNDGLLSGTVTSGGTGIVGANVFVSGPGGGNVTTGVGGAYSISISAGTHTVTASATGYLSSSASVTMPPGGPATKNFVLIVSSTLTGTVTDGSTGLPLPGATVTITTGSPTGSSPATTNASGVYTITGLSAGTYRVTGSRSGYTSKTSANISVSGASTTAPVLPLWPDHCGVSGGALGKWDCGYGTGVCPSVIRPAGGDVSCTFNDTNRIRPGTYTDITIATDQCAWIDPIGDPTGLQTGQSPGVVFIKGTLSMGSSSFLFGDGVTIVLDEGADVQVGNSGGFVLNYGTKYVGSSCDLVTPTALGDPKCFRHVPTSGTSNPGNTYDGNDYTLGAWAVDIKTKNGISPWTTCASPTPPAYDVTCVDPDVIDRSLGVTWYLQGQSSLGNGHRFYFDGAMGFLFNGILYGPEDAIKIGGQGAQASAGQIIGWTIEYAGQTEIHHRYAGIQTDGPPYLIEPFLGQ